MPDIYIPLLHPKLVHFPIAFFMGAAGLEILSLIFRKEKFHSTAVHFYVLGALVSMLTVWSGLAEAQHINLHHPVLDLHKQFALLTMWGSLGSLPILWFVHKRNSKVFKVIFLICTLMITVFVAVTGYNGGRMVYEYGVGVEK